MLINQLNIEPDGIEPKVMYALLIMMSYAD